MTRVLSITFSLALLSILMCNKAFSQADSEFGYVDSAFAQKVEKFGGRKIILKTNPLAIISGDVPIMSSEFRILGERVTGPKTSIVAGVSYLGMGLLYRQLIDGDSSNTSGLTSWDYGFNGYRLQGGFKYYLKNPSISIMDPDFKPAPAGVYLEPLVSYSNSRFYLKSSPGDYYAFTHWSISANVGIQFLIGERVTMDPFWGIGYKENKITNHGATAPITQSDIEGDFIYDSNLKINIGFNLGIRF